jgi:PIN domain nuclease of toxin-antitoxin system
MGSPEVILVDTHVVIWLAADPRRLSRKAVAAIEHARRGQGGGLAIAVFTLFELAHMVVRKRIKVTLPIESFLEDIASRFVVIPLNARIAAKAVQLPSTYPNDPMDRIIGATALVEGLELVTADESIRRAKVLPTIW